MSLLLLAFTAGCGGPDEPGDSQPGLWPDGEGWKLVETARIGTIEGDGPEVFSSIVDVTVDPMKRVWIADGQQQDIRIFDEQGRHLRTIGRKGAGPAEFRSISGMQWESKNRLWVLDGGNARFAIYDTTGALVETKTRQSILTTAPWPGGFDRHGRFYDVDGGIASDGSILTSIVRYAGGAARDTFAIPFFAPEVFELRQGNAKNRIISQVNVPFAGVQLWVLDSDGYVWIANTKRYRIERHAFAGGVERVVQRSYVPVRVGPAERERRLEDYRDFVREGGAIDPSRIPRTYPALYGFLADDQGHLWVSPMGRESDGRMLDVFRLDGTYLGSVALPVARRSSPRVIRGDRMLVITKDSLDIPSVIVFRIEKPRG